ncbi:hypothetical protein [Streptomyces sp. NBC_01187]|uniref:hypothetical protein n=1 Tax=Streptomyces sp. NBC_01187 TaxID=2903766 RepID=UPI002F90B502|nr:hypothetical protein OG220_40145 [Streptomyces sp. NBC_01187]WSS46999.1 hypothetical protein OG220_41480 [Streptomyces sp. NBC_01187]
MKLKLLGPAMAAAALIGATMTGGVASASTVAAAPSTAAAETGAASACSEQLGPVTPKESVKIRASKSAGATARGLWPKGKKGYLCYAGVKKNGGTHGLCTKGTSKKWFYVSYGNTKGWVPATCVNA